MATIDASIPLGVKPFQMESPVNQLAKLMQVKQLQQEGELGQMKMDEYRRGIEDQNALRSALSAPGADPYNVLLQRGKVKEAIDFQKGNAEVGKITAETKKYGADTEKSQLETARGRVALIGQLAGAVKDQASLDRALMIARTHGIDTSNIPPVYDPATIQQVRNSALTVEQQLEQVWKQKGYDLDVAKAGETVRHNKSTEGIQIRGQNLADARSRESNAQGRVPAGYRQKADGTLEFIPGGPADPNAAKKAAPTEFQGKAAMFGTRAQEADRIISDLEGKYSPTGINTKQALGRTPLVGGGLEAASNLTLSDSSQKAEQAQRDFVNAVLRLESGAAIGKDEFDNARRQYFTQPGDKPDVIAQKARNRKTAIQGLLNNARPGAVEQSGGATGSFETSPNIESLLKKYGGK